MEEIKVSFSQKAAAHQLGAFFDTANTRKWYIPDDVADDVREALRNLKNAPEIVSDISLCDTNNDTDSDHFDTDMCAPFSGISDLNEEEWDSVLEKEDVLRTLMAIRDCGIPENENQRIRMLQILSRRRPGDYPVTYDGVCACCDQFETVYPIEDIVRMMQDNVTGINSYAEEIRMSLRLNEEEKALLLFVMPL